MTLGVSGTATSSPVAAPVFVDKDQAFRVQVRLAGAPLSAGLGNIRPILLGGALRLFLRAARRAARASSSLTSYSYVPLFGPMNVTSRTPSA